MIRLLYISFSRQDHYYNDPSFRYRCCFPAENHFQNGWHIDIIHINQLRLRDINQYNALIFHRPYYNTKLYDILNTASRLSILTIADYDDLIFEPNYVDYSPAVINGMNSNLARRRAESYENAFFLFTHFWLSTSPLKDIVLNKLPSANATVIYNMIPSRWVNMVKHSKAHSKFEKKTIKYMPGTKHHDHDFDLISDALSELLHQNKNISLEIVGPLNFDESIFPKTQLTLTPSVRYEYLPKLIDKSWITLAPLENNIFNQCKSALKFWESAVFSVPVLASPIHDMQRLENPGLLICHNTTEWINSINKLINQDYYLMTSHAAMEKAKSCILENNIDIRMDYISNEVRQ